jgi:hypothetical protein
MEPRQLLFIHLEEGLKAYNEGNTLKKLAIYLSTATEVYEMTTNPEAFKKRLIEAASMEPEEAKEVDDFFTLTLEPFAKRWKKPFGESERQIMEMMIGIQAMTKLADSQKQESPS